MKQSDLDWDYLRAGMLLPLVFLLLAIALLAGSFLLKDRVASSYDTSQMRLGEAQQLRNQRNAKVQALDEFADQYFRLVQRGDVGDERRLQRVQNLRDSVSALNLAHARYTVSGVRAFEAPYLVPGVASQVYASTVQLNVGLGHELDLLRLFTLMEQAPGLSHVRSCELERVGDANLLSGARPNITGECSVEWLTIPIEPMLLAEVAG